MHSGKVFKEKRERERERERERGRERERRKRKKAKIYVQLGVIAHEVAHALGFWHEQSRPDRDQYVKVIWENIDKVSIYHLSFSLSHCQYNHPVSFQDSKGQFLKEEPDDVDNAGVPYDYGSIMHYRYGERERERDR